MLFKSWFIDWNKVGRKVIAQLPKEEHQPFIKWLEKNDDMLDLYEASPGKAIEEWHKSVDYYGL